MKVSPARRLMIDFMNSAAGFPSITAERRMRLGPVAEAQRAASRRPPWVAIFAKAYGLVARQFPAALGLSQVSLAALSNIPSALPPSRSSAPSGTNPLSLSSRSPIRPAARLSSYRIGLASTLGGSI